MEEMYAEKSVQDKVVSFASVIVVLNVLFAIVVYRPGYSLTLFS